MPTSLARLLHPRAVFAICALVFWLVAYSGLRSFAAAGAVVDMRVDSAGAGVAKWYLNRGGGFSEMESVSARLRGGSNDLRFVLPSATYVALRFDPIDNDAPVVVRSMRWHVAPDASGFAPDAKDLVALANMQSVVPEEGGIRAQPLPGSNDPQLQLPLAQPLTLAPLESAPRDALAATALTALVLAFAWLVLRLHTRVLVAAGLFLAAGLIVGLAAMSRTGTAHPDERAHAYVFEYLSDHVMPPAADDPGAQWTLSTFGYSYLFELNVSYWFAARTMAPLEGLFSSPEFAARAFQCACWLVLAALALRRRRESIALGVLLLSPQIWYVFAYFNGDAFSLLLAFLAVLLSAPAARVHAYLEGRAPWHAAFALALCLGLVLVAKANFLPLVPGLLLWLAVLHLDLRWHEIGAVLAAFVLLGAKVFMLASPAFAQSALPLAFGIGGDVLLLGAVLATSARCWRDAATRPRFVRLIGFAVLVFACAAPRWLDDLYVNGLPAAKAARIEAVEEAHARADLRPSVIAQGHGGEGTGLVLQHVGLGEMLWGPRYFWLGHTITTALGTYGYVDVLSPSWLYYLLLALVLACTGVASFGLWRAQRERAGRLLLVAAGTAFLVLESSALHSWIEAFQPQGRYLFPAFVMLAVVVAYAERALPRVPFKLLLAASLLASAGSFVFVALPAFGVAR